MMRSSSRPHTTDVPHRVRSPWRGWLGPSQLGIVLVAVAVSAMSLAQIDFRGWALLATTARLVAAVLVLALPWGTGLGWCLVRTDLAGRRLAGRLLAGLLFVPLVVLAGAWQAGFDRLGPLAGWLPPVGAPTGFWAAVWVHGVAAVPWVTLLAGLGFRAVEHEWEDQARLEQGPWSVWWGVTFPRVLPWLVASAVWVGCQVAGEIVVTDLFRVRTWAEELYTELALGGDLEAGPLSYRAGAVLWLAVSSTSALVLSRLAPTPLTPAWRQGSLRSLGQGRLFAAGFVIVSLAVLVGLPVLDLATRLGIQVTPGPSGLERSWSLARAVSVLGACAAQCGPDAGRSLELGLGATGLAMGLALAAGGVVLERPRWRLAWTLGLAILLAWPAPAVGAAVVALFNRPEVPPLIWLYDRSLVPTVLALALRGLPLAGLTVAAAWSSLPRSLWESARLEGLSATRALIRVAIPQAAPALIGGGLLVFAQVTADVGASVLVVPPGVAPLSLRVFNLIHYGVDEQVAAISLIWVVLGMCLALALPWPRQDRAES